VQDTNGYRPHLLAGKAAEDDWVKNLELSGAQNFMLEQARERPLRTLVLYGSLRERAYSKLLAYEFARYDSPGLFMSAEKQYNLVYQC
jgi:arsenic resistance protein ArsH